MVHGLYLAAATGKKAPSGASYNIAASVLILLKVQKNIVDSQRFPQQVYFFVFLLFNLEENSLISTFRFVS